MAEEFVDHESESAPEPPELPRGQKHDRQPVRILLIGSRPGITNIMLTLYQLGFAQMHEWSEPEPAPNSHQWMSVTTKSVRLD
jgi:hypothetical protein